MNHKSMDTLEYPKIKQQILPFLITQAGKNELSNLQPSPDSKVVTKRLLDTDDGFHILRLQEEIPLTRIKDITPYMKRLAIQANLNGKELAQVANILFTVHKIINFFRHLKVKKVELHSLYDVVKGLQTLPSLTTQLRHSVDLTGRILDGASDELYGLRKRITRSEDKIKEKMGHYTSGKNEHYLSEPIITVRDDRYVIPVKAEFRNHFGGIVHDQSGSGQTLYIEPGAVIDLNNRLRQDQLAAKQEENRILATLSDSLRPYQEEILSNTNILGKLDLINAKALYARSIKATLPKISVNNVVNLKRARHPLIEAHKVVGNDIKIGKDYETVVITGPNTGGKTITIKTLGLLQLMGQSGLFIPVNEGSQIGVFNDVFADIGDEQSIENNLSTFSSHMDNIVKIIHHITKRSLVILDEVGAGTDPREGAALAMAILDYIGSHGSEVIATTHYPELKTYAYNRPKTINASMEFNLKTLKPTYHLLLGVPGQSNGLNIAKKLGLPIEVIQQAESETSDSSKDINNMITELTKQTRSARQSSELLRERLFDATKLYHDLNNKFERYEKRKDKLDIDAKERANQIVQETKEKANKIIKNLHQKQHQLKHNAVKENELIDAKGELNSLHQNISLKNNRVLKREKAKHQFVKGDDVLVRSYGQQGVLLKKLSNHNWEVQIGILKMKINESNLEKINGAKSAPKKQYSHVTRTGSNALSTKLDLRGQRYESAMHQLDHYIDSALLAGYPSVTIIHGKGTGALRQGVNKYLKRNRRVKSFGYSAPNAGGDGSTIVKFK